ncbi:hypothetical protein [Algibacter sp. L1A34]|uniref:hypothetical protein n=1 Tax=Algibacter sp. L1A34 TaxID=2686365 RepID=UPI00131B1070|nr:hypothetical protein [Algibacter sp. L1A34]
MEKRTTFIIEITFIWVGYICAISFMEAWLKFRAPGITIELGLGIGQLVFNALNKVEIICAALIIVISLSYKENPKNNFKWLFIITVFIVLLQSFWLLPALDERAVLVMNNQSVPKSSLHLWFVLCEVIKVTCLVLYGISKFKISKTKFIKNDYALFI